MAQISVRNLYHAFAGAPVESAVLDDLSFDVASHEVLTVLGPSGCGKTTLLRCLAGLMKPSSGSIRIEGELPDELRRRRALGFGFQEPSLMNWRSVEQNIALPGELGRPTSVGRSHANRIDRLLSLTRLEAFRTSFPRQLSVGMKNRVALARALLLPPEVLLLDEPLAGLDLLTRTELMPEIARLLDEFRCTTIIVTHSVDEAVFWGTEIMLLSARPARILASLRQPTPFPRPTSYMDTPDFHAFTKECRSMILSQTVDYGLKHDPS